MKIAICGVNSVELLKKVESHFNVESVNVIGNIYDTAKATYEYDNVENVVFNGCVLDYAVNDIHPLDEQILLCSLSNIDVVYVYTFGMTTEEISKYHQYDEFFKAKVVDVVDLDTFVID